MNSCRTEYQLSLALNSSVFLQMMPSSSLAERLTDWTSDSLIRSRHSWVRSDSFGGEKQKCKLSVIRVRMTSLMLLGRGLQRWRLSLEKSVILFKHIIYCNLPVTARNQTSAKHQVCSCLHNSFVLYSHKIQLHTGHTTWWWCYVHHCQKN